MKKKFVAYGVAIALGSFSGSLWAAVISEVEPNDTPGLADPIAFGDNYSGEINPDSDTDTVSFLASGGEIILAETMLGSLPDSTLRLLDQDGATELAYNDDAGSLASRIAVRLPSVAGIYYLQVQSCCFGGSAGTYALRLRKSYVVTDKATLAGLTVDSVIDCERTLGTYCAGGTGQADNGVAPDPANISAPCGLSFSSTAPTSSDALASTDHQYVHGSTTPIVADMGAPVNTVFAFPAVDHLPFPEEGIESTIWGSDSCDISTFPSAWTLATLTKIYARGWDDPAVCQGQDNADDYVGQYSFFGAGFRYIGVYADFSISIFDTSAHTTWTAAGDDSGADGWQSFDEEIDAVGTPVCEPGDVVADAGPDQVALVGEQACFDATNSSGTGITFAWDFDGNGVIDAFGPLVCVECTDCTMRTATLFVTDSCGCVATDTVNYECCTRPMITCPAELVVRCTTPDGLPVDGIEIEVLSEPEKEEPGDEFEDENEIEVIVTDLCDMDVTVTDNRPADFYPSSCPNDRPTVLTFTARTDCGLEATCQTRVYVYGPMCCPGFVDGELTLMPADADLRQETEGPPITKANFDIWNEDERRFSGLHRCVSCWDSQLLSLYGSPNYFLGANLHTNKGRARVDGLSSQECPESVETPLLGVVVKEITFPGRIMDILRSAITPVGTGAQSATIRYDIVGSAQSAMTFNEPPTSVGADVGFVYDPRFIEVENPRGLKSAARVNSITESEIGNRQSAIGNSGAVAGINPGGRGDITHKGSLLFWPRVEVRWNALGEVIEDTFLDMANDSASDVEVQLYFVNGDAPLESECDPTCAIVFGGDCIFHPECILERPHPGWNKSDVQLTLTANQPIYWSAATGDPLNISPWSVLDPGDAPGRPDLDPRNPGGRVLRGFIVGWAVNAEDREICWNHLTGDALLVHYRDSSAAEYNAWAFQCVSGVAQGAETDAFPGVLNMDGMEYEFVPDALTFDFYTVGSTILSHPALRSPRNGIAVDTE